MNIKIRSANFELTPAIDEYVNKKISSLEKFFGNKDLSRDNILCEVEIGRTTHHKRWDIFRAEINIDVPGGKQVYAVANEPDLYAAIDVVRDEAEREIVSSKNKYHTIFRKGASKVKALLKRLDFRK